MARAGVEKAIIDNFNQSGYDKDKLDKDNLTIAESALGKVIYNLYKKPDGEVAADIPMLLYMYRELRSSEKQVDEAATLKRKQKVAKALNITLEELSKRKEGKGLVVYQTDADEIGRAHV